MPPRAGGRSRVQAQAPPAPAPTQEQEVIDIQLSDEEPAPQRDVQPSGQGSSLPLAARVPGLAAQHARPARSVDSTDSQSGRKALDIEFFFTDKSLGQPLRYCIECQKELAANPEGLTPARNFSYSWTTSNGPLRAHLEKFHKDLYLEKCREKGWTNQLPSAKLEIKASLPARSSLPPFSHDAVIEQIVRFIVSTDQAISVVDHREFRKLLTMFRDDFGEEELPHRSKIGTVILATWRLWFQELKVALQKAEGEPSFTMDLWSDEKKTSYICLTTHWLSFRKKDDRTGKGEDLTLNTSLLAFHPIYGPHTGQNIANLVYKLLQRAGIDGNRGFWTMDNASNNDTFLKCLARIYRRRGPGMTFRAAERRIRCFPHVVNICAQHTIKALAKDVPERDVGEDEVGDEEDFSDEEGNGEGGGGNGDDGAGGAGAVAVSGDSDSESDGNGDGNGDGDGDGDDGSETAETPDLLKKVRALIRAVRASGQRQEAFARTIAAGNELRWWKDAHKAVTVLRPKKFLLDVRTRWDSTYQMLIRLLEMRQPLERFLDADPQGQAIAHLGLEVAEWNRVVEVIAILQYPHMVQQVMSKEKTPVLAGTIPTLERFMTAWEKLKDTQPQLAPFIETGLRYAYKYYERLDSTSAYIVALFLHPGIRMSWVREHWEQPFFNNAEAKIKHVMNEYRDKNGPVTAASNALRSTSQTTTQEGWINLGLPSHLVVGDDDLNWADTSTQEQSVDDEYHLYAFGARSRMDINILKFWESHAEEFPTIYAMALDYLPIQASSVPCERAFSSSAETDTHRRNRLSPIYMEALQMLKFAFRNETIDFTAGLLTEEEEMILPRKVSRDVAPRLLAGLGNASTTREKEDALDDILRAAGGR